jgi:hypothetical protein
MRALGAKFMLKTLSVLAIVAAVATCALANDAMSGTMSWVSGTATATITPGAAAQTIVLKVGTTDVTYKDVIMIGNPATDSVSSGSAVELLLAGSQPFAANMTTDTIVAFTSYLSDSGLARRAIPTNSAGVLSYTIGYPSYENLTPGLELFYPTCNIANTYEFYGGIDMRIDVPLTKYSVTLPQPGSPSGVSTVVYPAGLPMYSFDFLAEGESTMEVGGRSTSTNVYCSGQFTGTVANFTATDFVITSAYED